MTHSRIAICLYKPELKSFDYSKFLAGNLDKVALKSPNNDIHLFQRSSKEKVPAWVDIIKAFSKADADKLKTSSSGAILIVKTKGRFFGCCFGTSVANVNRDNIESDFGLGAAFKRMVRGQTKSVESFTFSSNPITSQRTSSIPTIRDNFNIDVLTENIVELQGFYKQNLKRFLIKGKEFFSCPAIENLNDLFDLCQKLLLDYQNVTREREFKRLTATRKVKDRKTIDHLDDELCSMISNKSTEVYLTDYENFGDISCYRLPNSSIVQDLVISDLLQLGKRKQNIDANFLKSRKIVALDANENELSSWSLYKTIFVEVTIGTIHNILYKGTWYEIDKSYLSNLKSYIDNFNIDLSSIFPKWDGKESENTYSKKASKSLKGQLWDRILYTHSDYSYGIEFCDILTSDLIVHAKRYKSSSLNSHLLLQTQVCARLLESDPELLNWVEQESVKRFKKNILEKDVGSIKKKKKLLILLLSNTKKKPSEILPFFSLLTFKSILGNLQNMFTVKVGVV